MKKNTFLKSFFVVLLFTVVGLSSVVKAGTSYANPYNRCVIHVDKSFYVTGEVIWFKAFLPSSLDYGRSVVKAQIVNKGGEAIYTKYIQIDEFNSAEGYFRIPYEFNAAIYFLVLTVNKEDGNLAFPLVYHPLAIYNDLKADFLILDKIQSDSVEIETVENGNDDLVDFEIEKTVYEPGEKINIKLHLPEGYNLQKNNFSLSVVNSEISSFNFGGLSNISIGPAIEDKFLVDNEIALRGRATDGNNDPYEGDFLAYVIDEDGLLGMFESYEDGTFEIDLPFFQGERIVQLLDYGRWDISFSLERDINIPNNLKNLELIYNETVVKYMKESRQRKKINQLFQQFEYKEFPMPAPANNFFVPDRSFELANFPRFDEMAMFFKQFSTPFKLKPKKDGRIEIRMVNPENKPFYPGQPRFMVNGNFIQDNNYVVRLDMNEIERIDLFYISGNLKRQFDLLGNQGIVSIYTNDKMKEEVSAKTVNTFEIYGGTPVVEYETILPARSDSSENPLFRSLIYWKPNIEFGDNGEVEISFYHTDDKGNFKVEVIGEVGGTLAYKVE